MIVARSRDRWGRHAAVLSLVAGIVGEAAAYSGFVTTMPALPAGATATAAGPASVTTGLQLTIDTRWVDGGGYRPTKLRVKATTAAPRDREVEVVVTGVASDGAETRCGTTFALPSGATELESELLLPMTHAWAFVWWETRVDGVVDRSLSRTRREARSANLGLQGAQRPSLTLMKPATPADSYDGARSGEAKVFPELPGLAIDTSVGQSADSWLDYSGVDILAMDLDAITALADDEARFDALRRWMAAGGTLWAEHAGAEPGELNALADLLDADRWRFGAASEPGDVAVEGAPGWRYESLAPKRETPNRLAEDFADQLRRGDFADMAATLVGRDSRGWYAVREYGFGRIQAFPATALVVPSGVNLANRQRAVERWTRLGWERRYGLGFNAPSEQFGNLLVPGVGVAPVGEFQVLITLFVLGIGPLNYWLLWRTQRLHLLVLTTPLAAAAVTLGLVAYATLSDGFGVKARVRSLTMLSQGEDGSTHAASWSRVSHYAARSPGEAFSFDGDSAVYPIPPAWESAIAEGDTGPRVVDWSTGRQTLERGWLPTRTATQHLVVRSNETERGLQFRPVETPDECRNELGADVEVLFVHDADGVWKRADGIDAGGTGRLEPVERLEAVAELRSVLLDNEPEFPAGAGQSAEETLDRLGADRRLRRRLRNFAGLTLEENLMNAALDRLVGLQGSTPLAVPPRTYIAIARTAIETPLGYEGVDVREVGSFHIVLGRW